MIVMLCTRARGGMSAVVEAYREAGLFDRRQVRVLHTHDEGSAIRRLWLAAHALALFALMLLRGEVTLVHAHIAMKGSFWRKSVFVALAQKFGVPVIGHLHGSTFEQFVAELPARRRRVVIKRLQSMQRVVVLGEHWRRFVLTIAPGARVEVLPNSVSLPAGAPIRSTDGVVRLLFLGIVGHRKGIYELLTAMAAVHTRCGNVRLTVAGNGEIEKARDAATQLGIASIVEYVGGIDGEAKSRLLQRSDVYVLPSLKEGLPVSILEAMSWGLPIVSTDVGAIAEAVRDGVDGVIIKPGDTDALQAAIIRLVESPALRERMGQAARQRVEEHFSQQAVLPKLEQLYDAVQLGGQ